METKQLSKTALWSGWIISVLVILFLLLDAGMKVVEAAPSMEGSIKLGWPADMVQPIGFILLACTILYAVPRTAVIGAILTTGYLGGAIAVMIHAQQPYYFPVVFGALTWLGLYLRDTRVQAFM
ncbi:DoxX family protein [Mucilaginibacter sp. UYCu711]|uniref:DoxX family protein n=1 Tax=Mucilaginibacter sp. UYCu711 TaxID=3156339 RepID=UPI003D2495E0